MNAILSFQKCLLKTAQISHKPKLIIMLISKKKAHVEGTVYLVFMYRSRQYYESKILHNIEVSLFPTVRGSLKTILFIENYTEYLSLFNTHLLTGSKLKLIDYLLHKQRLNCDFSQCIQNTVCVTKINPKYRTPSVSTPAYY